jgi:23S rRNA (guanosine2251-2'-O)-methyltransferase
MATLQCAAFSFPKVLAIYHIKLFNQIYEAVTRLGFLLLYRHMKYVILSDVRSSHNVGAIFRTCEGAGVDMLYLAGYTPHPIDRFGREVAEIKKTSLGASTMVPWTAADDIEALILKLQSQGVTVVAVEQTPQSISLYDFTPPVSVAYIFGNEITGVLPEVVSLCDAVVEIPMHGRKESLNVSVTTGIVLFQKPYADK